MRVLIHAAKSDPVLSLRTQSLALTPPGPQSRRRPTARRVGSYRLRIHNLSKHHRQLQATAISDFDAGLSNDPGVALMMFTTIGLL
jgi:hypothetical protein